MGRTVRDASLETRSARLKLPTGGKPRWRLIEPGLHLGYRRPKNGSGTWIARRYVGQGGYQERKLGTADDFIDVDEPKDADGVSTQDDDTDIRTFRQAQQDAVAWWRRERRKDSGQSPHTGPYTIMSACADYLKHYAANGGEGRVRR